MKKSKVSVLKYIKNGQLTTIYKPTKDEIKEAVLSIPPGALFITAGPMFIAKLIGWWGLIKVGFRAIIKYGIKIPVSHAGIYFGNGKNATIESTGVGVIEGNFMDYLYDDHKLAVWYNKNLTIDNLQNSMQWAYSQLGKRYDVKAFLAFILKDLGEDKDAYICSELATEIVRKQNVPFVWGEASKIHPVDIVEYIKSDGTKDGWVLCLSWNWE